MNTQKATARYVAFLRGINVGGHHKVPMAELRKELDKLGFDNIVTLLNSGNALFDAATDTLSGLENKISGHLEQVFGFPVPTMVRKAATISQLFDDAPFQGIEVTKDIRLYVSFLKNDTTADLELPWNSGDDAYKIIEKRDKTIVSVLDLSISKTPKAMEALERFYGKDITTRNWKTIERIVNKL